MTAQNIKLNKKGFTLIELLVVIGILAILLAITLIAINPARQFGQANDTKRRSAATQLLNAIGAYSADHQGQLPAAITTSNQEISDAAADVCADLVPDYIPALPRDPSLTGVSDYPPPCPAGYTTGYEVVADANDRVTITAPSTEIATPDISVTR